MRGPRDLFTRYIKVHSIQDVYAWFRIASIIMSSQLLSPTLAIFLPYAATVTIYPASASPWHLK